MTTDAKPREFWIVEYDDENREAFVDHEIEDKLTGTTHVIEKSAYDAIAAKLAIAVSVLKDLSTRHDWSPDMGKCVCEQHKRARDLLAKIGGAE